MKHASAKHKHEYYAGIMSGTSLDGIDIALVDFASGAPQFVAAYFEPYQDALRQDLLALHHPAHNELHLAQLMSNTLAHAYAKACAMLLDEHDIPPDQIIAIGCHGQTIRHRPESGYTLQLGNAALLAELTGITVVNDFRSRDIAAGGQGAPLVPAFHHQVFRNSATHRVIVNIGGISNLTNLAPGLATSGFDCGPGNLLMDAWIYRHLGQQYDREGAWARSGKMIPSLMKQLLEDPYFGAPPPKSSGRDLFNLIWLEKHLHGNEKPEDVQATLLELTCRSIADSIQKHCSGTREIYLCGGGAHNAALLDRLQQLLPGTTLSLTDSLGISADWLEAIAFAWLARQTILGHPANLPEVTGAQHPCILGAIHQA